MNVKIFFIVFLFFGTCGGQEQSCTDPLANNFNPNAELNDGSCTYDRVTLAPEITFNLSEQVSYTSGLIFWDGLIWTHNDHGDAKLFGLDMANGEVVKTIDLSSLTLDDWEDIAQDEDYIYMGDFGNNASGDRTDLKVLRVAKGSLKTGKQQIDTIWFSYEDQVDMSPREANQTDFDCEAFVIVEDEIFLFTKEWVSARTSVYVLPNKPGIHKAVKKGSYNVEGLITGATLLESKNLLVLCGYTILLQPFIYLLYDFEGTDFFSGNKRKVSLSIPFHQVEGIATKDGITYYLSNEAHSLPPIPSVSQKLHIYNLDFLLNN